MSSDDELLARGRLLTEYTETKQRLVALRAAGRSMSTIITAFAQELQGQTVVGGSPATVRDHIVHVSYLGAAHLNTQGKWPSLDEVVSLISDMKSTRERLDVLTKELKNLGIPVDER